MEPLVFARAHTPSPPPLTGPVVPLPVTTNKPRRHDVAALFESEESGLLRFAIGLVRQRMVAEELVQDAFLRVRMRWDGIEHPAAYLRAARWLHG